MRRLAVLAILFIFAIGCVPVRVQQAIKGNDTTARELRDALVPVLDGLKDLDDMGLYERGELADKLEANVVRSEALRKWAFDEKDEEEVEDE